MLKVLNKIQCSVLVRKWALFPQLVEVNVAYNLLEGQFDNKYQVLKCITQAMLNQHLSRKPPLPFYEATPNRSGPSVELQWTPDPHTDVHLRYKLCLHSHVSVQSAK